MFALRKSFRSFATLWIAFLAASLILKALIPGGMMVQTGNMSLTVTVCTDATIGPKTVTLAIPVKGQSEPQNSKKRCDFNALGMGALMPAAAFVLAALAFVRSLALLPARSLAVRSPGRLRPPLRGPPITS